MERSRRSRRRRATPLDCGRPLGSAIIGYQNKSNTNLSEPVVVVVVVVVVWGGVGWGGVCVCWWWWWWWFGRCVDGRSLSIDHLVRAPNSGRTPGSQTPGVPATPEPSSTHSCECSRAEKWALKSTEDERQTWRHNRHNTESKISWELP